jgi:hypothetical protein
MIKEFITEKDLHTAVEALPMKIECITDSIVAYNPVLRSEIDCLYTAVTSFIFTAISVGTAGKTIVETTMNDINKVISFRTNTETALRHINEATAAIAVYLPANSL